MKNAVAVAKKATNMGLPVEQYGEIMLEQQKMMFQYELKRMDVELELLKTHKETESLIKLQLTQRSLAFQNLDQIIGRLASRKLLIESLSTGSQVWADIRTKIETDCAGILMRPSREAPVTVAHRFPTTLDSRITNG